MFISVGYIYTPQRLLERKLLHHRYARDQPENLLRGPNRRIAALFIETLCRDRARETNLWQAPIPSFTLQRQKEIEQWLGVSLDIAGDSVRHPSGDPVFATVSSIAAASLSPEEIGRDGA